MTSSSFAEIRHLQRTEVREVEEPFREGTQKGSSAMPHKRNPWRCEQLCGLRVLRGNLQAGLEDIALWHERDISHSSVERIVLADSAQLVYYMLVQFGRIAEGCASIPTACSRTSTRRTGSCSASRCCSRWSTPGALATTPTGSCSAATRTWEERRPFRTVLAEDPEVLATLSPDRLDECFELRRALAHAGRAVDALDILDAASVTGILLHRAYREGPRSTTWTTTAC